MRPGTKPRIVVVDYGMGNLASVAKALERSGADVRVTESAAAVRDAAAVVLPGVGAFRDAAARLEQSGLGAAVLERIAAGTPFLGVCLGLQLLFESSAEGGRWPGLGVFAGTVERLQTGLKVPHIGWNELEWAPGRAGQGPRLPPPGPPSTSCTRTPRCPPTRRSSPPVQTTAGRWSPPSPAVVYGRCSSTPRRAPSWA
jgi:glutamine amidotransferase